MSIYVFIWTLLTIVSIGWYALLLFYIGYKGGKEIIEMTRELRKRNSANDRPAET
jgi:hypothetical protein